MPAEAQATSTIQRTRRSPRRLRLNQRSIVLAGFALLFVALSAFVPGFLRVENLLALLQNVALLGLLGIGMAIVVIGRGIDISIVAALAVPSGLVLSLVQSELPLAVALATGFAVALAFGLVNGWLIAYGEVPALFTTLASGLFLAGLGQTFFFQFDVVQWSPGMEPLAWLGRGRLLGIPVPIVVFAAAALVAWAILNRTQVGAYIRAVGDNAAAARATGIATRPVVLAQYAMASVIGFLAGLVMAASVNSMPTRVFSSTLVYDVVLVVVLGGIGLSGGRGGVSNVLVGTLLIGTMLNGMTILDIGYSSQNLIKGIVLLVAILIDSLANPRDENTAQQGDI